MDSSPSALEWTPDALPTPCGEDVERVLTITARQNPYSRDGLSLWRQNALHRKRLRTEDGYRDMPSEIDGDQVSAAAQRVNAAIHQLVQSSGFEYAPAPPPRETMPSPSPLASFDGTVDLRPTGGVLETPTLSTPHAPSPTTAVVGAVATPASPTATPTGMPPPQPQPHAPMSSLAKLVARAKAQQPVSSHSPLAASAVTTPMEPDSRPLHSASAQAARTENATIARSQHPENEGAKEDDDEDFGVVVPGASSLPTCEGGDDHGSDSTDASASMAKHPSQMTREEYLRQFKRAPRRGEMGQDADTILAAEKLGYVMSGSRSKASQMYVDRIQRQLHEREASKLQQQFRKVEDARQDDHLINGLLSLLEAKRKRSS